MRTDTSVPCRRGTRLLSVALLVVPLLAGAAAFAHPAAAFTTKDNVRLNSVEARLVARINSVRVARGIPALKVAPGYTDVARRWAATQATEQRMYHNANMVSQLAASGGSGWRAIGENVGYGYDADSLFGAYWNSPPHRANILNASFHFIGMGWVERPGGMGYNTQNFVSHYSTSYGRTHVPAYGGRADSRVLTSATGFAGFESGSDQRVAPYASSGLVATTRVDSPVRGIDNALRLAIRERTNGTGGSAGSRLRDAVDMRHVTRLTVRIGATSATGRAVAVRLVARTAYGTSVTLGTVTVASGTTKVATFTMPAAARSFRNEILVDMSRTALHALSSSVANRSASIAVYSMSMYV